mgnify:CR=1 FL=1
MCMHTVPQALLSLSFIRLGGLQEKGGLAVLQVGCWLAESLAVAGLLPLASSCLSRQSLVTRARRLVRHRGSLPLDRGCPTAMQDQLSTQTTCRFDPCLQSGFMPTLSPCLFTLWPAFCFTCGLPGSLWRRFRLAFCFWYTVASVIL